MSKFWMLMLKDAFQLSKAGACKLSLSTQMQLITTDCQTLYSMLFHGTIEESGTFGLGNLKKGISVL